MAAVADFDPEVVDNPTDEYFLAWAKANAADCTHEELERAKVATAHLVRRPRKLLAEYRHVFARVIVAQKISEGWKKSAAVDFAAAELGLSKRWENRTVWTALKPSPPAPPLTNERLRQILADNIEIAERSGNTRAVELLRRMAATF